MNDLSFLETSMSNQDRQNNSEEMKNKTVALNQCLK
jgi:hypothetical protein